MSISSHLTPEPERRLWIIHEKLRADGERAELKLAALAVFAALELALIAGGPRAGANYAAILLLCAVLPLCLFAVSPFIESPGPVGPLETGRKPHQAESLLSARELAKYPHMELVIVLDRYLGGGITATRYYEDIVAQILQTARIVSRRARFFMAASSVALAAQVALAVSLAARQ